MGNFYTDLLCLGQAIEKDKPRGEANEPASFAQSQTAAASCP